MVRNIQRERWIKKYKSDIYEIYELFIEPYFQVSFKTFCNFVYEYS
jgi:hypothetical protein